MIARMSRNMSSYFVLHGIISEDDRDVYVYSFEIMLSTLQSFLALAVLAIVFGSVLETMIFLTGFVPLRLIAGGYHAKNHFRCFLILMFVYSAFLLVLFYLPLEFMLPVIVTSCLVSWVLVFLFAPSDDNNKPLTSEETVRFRKKSRITIVCYSVMLAAITVFVTDKRYALSLAFGIITVGLSLLANRIKRRYQIGKNKTTSGEEWIYQ